MSTATSEAPPKPVPSTYRTYDEALAAARRLVEAVGGGVPVLARHEDGSVSVEAVVRDVAPAEAPAAPMAVSLDERGRVIPPTQAERAERAAAAARYIAAVDAEPLGDEEEARKEEEVLEALEAHHVAPAGRG